MHSFTNIRTDEIILMVDSQVLPIVTVKLVVAAPTVHYHSRAFVDVTLDDVYQGLCVSLVFGTQRQKHILRLAANSANDPLAFHQPSLIISTFLKFTFVYLHSQPCTPINFGFSLAIVSKHTSLQ